MPGGQRKLHRRSPLQYRILQAGGLARNCRRRLQEASDVVGRIEGYAIISEDGMLANSARIMPDSLKFEADARFFERGLDAVDVVVHGRHSQEQQPHSRMRHRLILTRSIAGIASRHPSNERALLWNPAGASFEAALSALGRPDAGVAVIGGAEVFALFLDRYDVFYLSRAPGVRLPGGRPVFPEVPMLTPEQVLAAHNLHPDEPEMLDPAKGLTMVRWRREKVTFTP
jgi:dihydrofolate reductase